MSRVSELWSRLSPNAQRGVIGGGLGVLAIALVAGVWATSGEDAEPKPTTTTQAPTTTTTAIVTTTTEPETGPVAQLTGLRVANGYLLLRPALAVKVDNLDAPGETALPQRGLPKADIVFEEIVEGNITRLVAVFHSQQPGKVGPVRSARTTDVELLPMLGHPLLAWSGGNEGVVAAVRSSPFIIDAGYDAATSAYARDSSLHGAPHNLFVQGDDLWAKTPEGTPMPTPMFQYRTSGQANPPNAQASLGVDISWGGGGVTAPVSWRWDGNARLYVRNQRGRPHKDADGTVITAKNVVVMVTEYGQSYADARSPQAKTIGSGELFVFTNGRVLHGTWNRPDIARPPTFVDDTGATILLSPGQTWIEMPRSGDTAAITG